MHNSDVEKKINTGYLKMAFKVKPVLHYPYLNKNVLHFPVSL